MKLPLLILAVINYVFSQLPGREIDKATVDAILFVGLCVLISGIKNK